MESYIKQISVLPSLNNNKNNIDNIFGDIKDWKHFSIVFSWSALACLVTLKQKTPC